MGRWSHRVALLFLAWLRVPTYKRWLDVGCGTGALCTAILESYSPAAVVGVGLLEVQGTTLEVPTPFASFEDY